MSEPIESTSPLQTDVIQDAIHARVGLRIVESHGGFVGPAGLARMWGVNRQRIHQYAAMDGFPEPLYVGGGSSRVWLMSECVAWKLVRELR